MGKDCIDASGGHKRLSDAASTSSPVALGFGVNPRVQGYRVKRTSACGGCLGDHRR